MRCHACHRRPVAARHGNAAPWPSPWPWLRTYQKGYFKSTVPNYLSRSPHILCRVFLTCSRSSVYSDLEKKKEKKWSWYFLNRDKAVEKSGKKRKKDRKNRRFSVAASRAFVFFFCFLSSVCHKSLWTNNEDRRRGSFQSSYPLRTSAYVYPAWWLIFNESQFFFRCVYYLYRVSLLLSFQTLFSISVSLLLCSFTRTHIHTSQCNITVNDSSIFEYENDNFSARLSFIHVWNFVIASKSFYVCLFLPRNLFVWSRITKRSKEKWNDYENRE